MKFRVLDSFKATTSQGEMTLEPGQIITLPHDLAITLVNQGRVAPIGRTAVKIYSEILGEELWVVATEQDMEALLREQITDVIYTASEVRELKGKPSEHLRAVHEIKRVFPGSQVAEDLGPDTRGEN